MRKLQTLFEERRSLLAENLSREETLDGLLRVTQSEMERFIGGAGSFTAELTVREHAMLTALFNSVVTSLDLLRLLSIKNPPAEAHRSRQQATFSRAEMPASIPPAVVAAAVTLLTVTTTGPFSLALGAAAGTAAGAVTTQAIGRNRERRSDIAEQSNPPVERAKIDIDAVRNRLPTVLATAAGNFDRIAMEMGVVRTEALKSQPPQKPQVEDIPNVLPLLHDLMSDEDDAEGRLRQYARLSERILKVAGIQCASYEPGINDQMFDKELGGEGVVQSTRTSKPALVRDGRLLAKGPSLSRRDY